MQVITNEEKPVSIFISYRRSDSQSSTGRIYDRLRERFGAQCIFRDIDSIPLGVSFPQLLRATLSQTNAVLVIIGPTWLTVENDCGQPRLEDAEDFVRMEVETSLRLNVPVVPVLVDNASMPMATQLPSSIEELSLRNGISVRPDPDFHHDVDRLTVKLEEIVDAPPPAPSASEAVEKQIAELELENTLLRLDHDWQVESQNGPSTEDSLQSAFAGCSLIVIAIVVMYFGFVGLGLIPLFVGICALIYVVSVSNSYHSKYKEYQNRKKEAIARKEAAVGSRESQPKEKSSAAIDDELAYRLLNEIEDQP